MEAPEVHTPHAGHYGGWPRWLELVIAITAFVTSISSIAIAVHHSHIMERLVQANSIPYLQGTFSDVTLEDQQVLSLALINRGGGPAHEQSLRVKVGDRYVKSVSEFLSASFGREQALKAEEVLHPIHNRVRARFISAGQTQIMFHMARAAENAQLGTCSQKSRTVGT